MHKINSPSLIKIWKFLKSYFSQLAGQQWVSGYCKSLKPSPNDIWTLNPFQSTFIYLNHFENLNVFSWFLPENQVATLLIQKVDFSYLISLIYFSKHSHISFTIFFVKRMWRPITQHNVCQLLKRPLVLQLHHITS